MLGNEGIIRWSPNVSRSDFMVFNLKNQVVRLYEATGFASPGHFDHEKISEHSDFPPVNTYDWSPTVRGLVAIGTSHGHVKLLRVDDSSDAVFELPQKLKRPVQSVAFNSQGLLAVGLDRIRNDSCLQIWDINQRLAEWDSSKKGWGMPEKPNAEPVKKLEGSTSITSIRFFEDNPQTLVTGVKNQGVRVYDLRDPNSSVITFQTKCCNNIAIDYNDQNCFASSTLDQPGFSIWDKRVSSRSTASPMYLEALDADEMPWGSALKQDNILQSAVKGYANTIKQLRYSREQRGCLGVLSTAGQLQIFETQKEFIEPGSVDEVEGSPDLLKIKRSYDLEYSYFDEDRQKKYEQRIVSFDWVSVGNSALQARVVALRGTGSFEILEMPNTHNKHIGNYIPFQTPHHAGDPYLALPKFENLDEALAVLGPTYRAAVEATFPVFGPDNITNPKVAAEVKEIVESNTKSPLDHVVDLIHRRKMTEDEKAADDLAKGVAGIEMSDIKDKGKGKVTDEDEAPAAADLYMKPFTSLEMHDINHYTVRSRAPISKKEREKLDNTMLHRAIAGYLFDCEKNQAIVKDDTWLQGVWEWVSINEALAKDDGMVAMPIDMSFMGVLPIWMNDLGGKPDSRVIETAIAEGAGDWEKYAHIINRKVNRKEFMGLNDTAKPELRMLCLATLGLLALDEEFEDELWKLINEGKHTLAAARALFANGPELAVQILKNAGGHLFYVAMTLEIKHKSGDAYQVDEAQWIQALEKQPEMVNDPYLRAIYNFIVTDELTNIVENPELPMRERVGVALRILDDDDLTYWLKEEMKLAIKNGDIEGIYLAGITDDMVDVFAKYIEKFGDMQTPMLILHFSYPRYIQDIRCDAWRKAYQAYLQDRKMHILRCKFEVQSMKKSRQRDGTPVIKPPPRQVTIRCLNCDKPATNDLANTGAASSSDAPAAKPMRNPLAATGIYAGLCCPKCGAHLPRCAVCMEIVGVPRSDRPEQSADPMIRKMANFPTFCLRCKHVTHMDHARAWFARHVECPVPECRCQCKNPPPLKEGEE